MSPKGFRNCDLDIFDNNKSSTEEPIPFHDFPVSNV